MVQVDYDNLRVSLDHVFNADKRHLVKSFNPTIKEIESFAAHLNQYK